MTPTNEGPFVVSEPCHACHGQGTISEQPCPTCHGTGVLRFYHGTKADLRSGDLIEPGYASNFGTRKKAKVPAGSPWWNRPARSRMTPI